jgi:hypothetical protein
MLSQLGPPIIAELEFAAISKKRAEHGNSEMGAFNCDGAFS